MHSSGHVSGHARFFVLFCFVLAVNVTRAEPVASLLLMVGCGVLMVVVMMVVMVVVVVAVVMVVVMILLVLVGGCR